MNHPTTINRERWYQHLKRIYNPLYTPLRRAAITNCYYCGHTAKLYDHVPPLSTLPEIPEHPLRLVPSCARCNNLLGNYTQTSILKRIERIALYSEDKAAFRTRWQTVNRDARHLLETITAAIEKGATT